MCIRDSLHELALGSLALVLLGAGLALAALYRHPALRHTQRLRDRGQGIEQTRLRLVRVHRTRRGVFLHVHPVTIQIDRQGVFLSLIHI